MAKMAYTVTIILFFYATEIAWKLIQAKTIANNWIRWIKWQELSLCYFDIFASIWDLM